MKMKKVPVLIAVFSFLLMSLFTGVVCAEASGIMETITGGGAALNRRPAVAWIW